MRIRPLRRIGTRLETFEMWVSKCIARANVVVPRNFIADYTFSPRPRYYRAEIATYKPIIASPLSHLATDTTETGASLRISRDKMNEEPNKTRARI